MNVIESDGAEDVGFGREIDKYLVNIIYRTMFELNPNEIA